jgi:Prokaryotic RING finger family 1
MVGRTCPYCRFDLEQGVGIIACPVCDAIHHDDCWRENGGCAVALCAGGPTRADAAQEPDQAEAHPRSPDAPPPEPAPEPMPVVIHPDPSEAPTLKSERLPPPPPAVPPGPPPPRGGGAPRGTWVPLIAVAIVLLGGAGAAAIVWTGSEEGPYENVSAGFETAAESEEFDETDFEEEGYEEESFEEEGYGEESYGEEEFEEEEFEEAEPSPSQLAQGQIQHALTAHFNRLASGSYESAYYDLTASEGEAAGGESAWVAAQEEDQLQSFNLTVETSLADAHSAQATIEEFETHAVATGCNRWYGYWQMRKIYGEWLIDSAKLEKEPC